MAAEEKFGVVILSFGGQSFYFVKEGKLDEKEMMEMEDELLVKFIDSLIEQNDRIANLDKVAANKRVIAKLEKKFQER